MFETCTGRITCGNVGDSRAIVGSLREGSIYLIIIVTVWSAKPLSQDHKPNLPGELKRIEARGGRVDCYRDQQGRAMGPMRVWLKTERIPGLAMSRSIGDFVAASVGVSAEPGTRTIIHINKRSASLWSMRAISSSWWPAMVCGSSCRMRWWCRPSHRSSSSGTSMVPVMRSWNELGVCGRRMIAPWWTISRSSWSSWIASWNVYDIYVCNMVSLCCCSCESLGGDVASIAQFPEEHPQLVDLLLLVPYGLKLSILYSLCMCECIPTSRFRGWESWRQHFRTVRPKISSTGSSCRAPQPSTRRLTWHGVEEWSWVGCPHTPPRSGSPSELWVRPCSSWLGILAAQSWSFCDVVAVLCVVNNEPSACCVCSSGGWLSCPYPPAPSSSTNWIDVSCPACELGRILRWCAASSTTYSFKMMVITYIRKCRCGSPWNRDLFVDRWSPWPTTSDVLVSPHSNRLMRPLDRFQL